MSTERPDITLPTSFQARFESWGGVKLWTDHYRDRQDAFDWNDDSFSTTAGYDDYNLGKDGYDKVEVPGTEIEMKPEGTSTVNLPAWVWLDRGTFQEATGGTPYRLRASITWEVTWQGSDGTGGDLPNGTFEATQDINVQEIQAVNR